MSDWLGKLVGGENKQPAEKSKRKTDKQHSVASPPELKIQQAYWTYDSAEKAALLSRYPAGLSWPELVRLHHLTCLELVREGSGKAELMAQDLGERITFQGDAVDLCKKLVRKLSCKDSPYRPRHCAIWQGQPGESEKREPNLEGMFQNASITHLGCLEVIRLDEQHSPKGIAFVPLDDLRGALFAGNALFRAGKLFYDDERQDEIVRIPLLYGLSWETPNAYDHDGTMTRFCGVVDAPEAVAANGVGVGHQDFVVTQQAEVTLFGLGSVGELMVMLSVDDPKFEQKCRARGLDPADTKQRRAEPGRG